MCVCPVSKQWYGCQCLGFLACAQMLMHAIAYGGCTDTVRESALEVDSGRKVPSRTGGSDPTSVSIAPDFSSVGLGSEYRQLSQAIPDPGIRWQSSWERNSAGRRGFQSCSSLPWNPLFTAPHYIRTSLSDSKENVGVAHETIQTNKQYLHV